MKKNNLAAPGFEPGLFMVVKFCFSQQFTSHGTSRGHPYYTLSSTYYTANVLTIKIMDFDHVPNPGIMSPQFLWCLKNRLKKKKKKKIGSKNVFFTGNGSLKPWWNDHKNWWNYAWKLWPLTIKYFSIFLLFFFI